MTTIAFSLILIHIVPTADIKVDVSQWEGTPVPREFFGQFGEHLGRNVYNGQWAQILRNPGFEGGELFGGDDQHAERSSGSAGGPELDVARHWRAEGEATYALDEENPFNSKVCQRITVTSRGGVSTPVTLPLHRVREYDLSFYARATRPVAASVQLRTKAGAQLCETLARVEGAEWKRYAATLEAPDGPGPGEPCCLALVFEGPATVWLDHTELFPADHMNGLDPDVVRLLKELDVSVLRFPGGNFVSGYHWRDGIGPREKRVAMRNPAWPGVEWNHFGTDEWMAFADAIGAEPMICVNSGNGTAEEAADWVRYCNGPADGPIGKLRAANGHREPYNVRYWEVGNELWGDWQIGHCTPEEYAKRYDAFSKAMLDADPDILLIANGGPGKWNEQFLKTVTEPVRSLSMHRLVGWGVRNDASAEDVAMGLSAYGLDFDKQLEGVRDVLQATGHPDAKIAITELMSVAPRKGGPRTCSRHAESLYFAGIMNACIRNRDLVELIARTAVINHGGGRAKILEVAFPEPVHFLSKIYGTMSGRRPVACEVDAPTYDTAVNGLPRVKGVPVLECVALLDDSGNELTLLVTNRDARSPRAATISIEGFSPAAKARTRTIAGSPDQFNVWDKPPHIKILEGETETKSVFEYSFPACSITEIVFVKAS